MMQDETTLPPETRGQEGGKGNPWVGRLQIAHMGNDQARKHIIAGIWSLGNCGGISAMDQYRLITGIGHIDGLTYPRQAGKGKPLTTVNAMAGR